MKLGILVIISIVFMLFLVSRTFNTFMHYDQATILLKPKYCDSIKEGERYHQYCKIIADVSFRFISGNPVIRTQEGIVMDLPKGAIISTGVQDVYYGLSWNELTEK